METLSLLRPTMVSPRFSGEIHRKPHFHEGKPWFIMVSPWFSLKSEKSPLHLADGAAEARQSLLGAKFRSDPMRSDPVLFYLYIYTSIKTYYVYIYILHRIQYINEYHGISSLFWLFSSLGCEKRGFEC